MLDFIRPYFFVGGFLVVGVREALGKGSAKGGGGGNKDGGDAAPASPCGKRWVVASGALSISLSCCN